MNNKASLVERVKGFFSGGAPAPSSIEQHGDTYFYGMFGTHSYGRRSMDFLLEIGYSQNPIVFGIIQDIIMSQSNINFKPWWDGEPYKTKKWSFDIEDATLQFLSTGNLFIWDKPINGFPNKPTIIPTITTMEEMEGKNWRYSYVDLDGHVIKLPLVGEGLVHIKFKDLEKVRSTGYGIAPLQVLIMAIESFREMYITDAALLKNKGVEGMITNDSDLPILGMDAQKFDAAINERLRGSRRAGGVATSTGKLRYLEMGRTIKELALWDGYKVKTRDVCTVFHYPSSLANDPDSKTYANYGESLKAKYTDCVIPFTKRITNNKDFVKMLGYEVFLDTSEIEVLQASQQQRYEKNKTITDTVVSLNTNIKNGTITNEIAVNIMVTEWGYDQNEAKKLFIANPTNQEPANEPEVITE